jgi:Fe(II)/alpha-ketoglutarate-dependent arginine beta-hydroxylase
VITYQLSAADLRGLGRAIDSVTALQAPAHDQALLEAVALTAHELPRDLRATLLGFRLHEPAGALLMRGFPVDGERIGATPGHWREPPPDAPVTREEAYLFLIGALLGEPFGWSTQQDGRMIHNVLPIRGHEQEQLGSSSVEPLWWHTEDAFHDYRADYVGLLCLRNPLRGVTTYADVSRLPIAEEDRRLLGEAVYRIRPDNSHRPEHNAADQQRSEAFAALQNTYTAPETVSVLFGDPADPYVRLDPYFMEEPADLRHAGALQRLRAQVDAALVDVVLEPGDHLVLDNFRAVHGRAPFHARFDGQDRWLKRICVSRDIRRSRPVRRAADDRLIYG